MRDKVLAHATWIGAVVMSRLPQIKEWLSVLALVLGIALTSRQLYLTFKTRERKSIREQMEEGHEEIE